MARKLVAVGLVAFCVIAGCAGQDVSGKEELQLAVNEWTAKVANVKASSPASVSTMLDQISMSINNIAGAWWEIEWASQQSQWDNLVQLANSVVQQIQTVLPSIPEMGGLVWASPNPNAELASVVTGVCEKVAELKSYAENKYGVLLTITAMTACPSDITSGANAPAPAPAPAVARRMLSA